MNKFKQILKTRKGFTLMELIIVLIIVAILAAALIPSFLGFVQRARNESLLSEARVGLAAAQVVMTELGVVPAVVPTDLGPGPATNERFLLLLQETATGGDSDVVSPLGFSEITANNMGRILTIRYTRSAPGQPGTVLLNTETGAVSYEPPAGGGGG